MHCVPYLKIPLTEVSPYIALFNVTLHIGQSTKNFYIGMLDIER